MMIIKPEANKNGQHPFQSQSHRQKCWLDGYVAVPPQLESAVLTCNGYCDTEIKNGVLKNVVPRPDLMPSEPEAKAEPSELETLRAEVEQLKSELAQIKGAVE